MFCKKRNMIGNICFVTMTGMSPATGRDCHQTIPTHTRGKGLTVTHLLTFSREFMIALSPACVASLCQVAAQHKTLLISPAPAPAPGPGQKNIIVSWPAVIRLSALTTLARSRVKYRSGEIILITLS